MKLNIGAGRKEMEGWTSLGLMPDHDIKSDIRWLRVPDNSVTEALACHVVEHIAPEQVPLMFEDWFRALAPGAELAIEGPDLVKCCRLVLAGDPQGEKGIFGRVIGEDVSALHRWGLTVSTLRRLLTDAGFIKIREEQPFFHGRRTNRDLRVVARKPHG